MLELQRNHIVNTNKSVQMAKMLKVAVIGAGLSGLVASRELQREGHQVVVYEKQDRIGGTWVYSPEVEADDHLLGEDPVHSSLYYSLRTNLPRSLMEFSDYPFVVRGKNGDSRNFPGHEEVLKYLNDFAREFELAELIRFNTHVVRVEQADPGRKDKWVVESRTKAGSSSSEEIFDAVVVCNGHYSAPRVPQLPGIEKWPGRQVHSHNYRVPEPYLNQVVVVIGNGPSAFDISLDVAGVAKEVHLSLNNSHVSAENVENNIWRHPKVYFAHEDGSITFQDGSSVHADVIIYCTGYNYEFPFLKTNGIVSIDDNRVGPLYKHVFTPQLGPWLSFVGIPLKVIIFRMAELQSKWIAKVLSGKILLPSEEEMFANVEEYYNRIQDSGTPKHHTHLLHTTQFESMDWMAAQLGLPPIEEDFKEIHRKWFAVLTTQGFDGFQLPKRRESFEVEA